MKPHIIIWISAISLLSCSESKPTKPAVPDPLTAQINAYLLAHVNNAKFNGSVFLAKGDSILYHQHYGLADRANEIAISDSTKFLIGSITKPFTAMAILLLEQDGALSLNDPLSKYFPDFPIADSVTIEQLLTHTSGIRDYHDFPDWPERSQSDIIPMDVIEQVKTDPYRFPPGTSFRYSNTGYILLGLIIEQVSKSSFDAYLNKAIIAPLGLKNTGVITNEWSPENLAKGYSTSPRETTPAAYINYNQPYSSGNMFATCQDLKTFTLAVMHSDLLPAEKTAEVFSNNAGYYGYDWGIRDFDGIKAYGHHGGMNGYWGSITFIPESETFLCFLTNDDNTPKYTINKALVDMLKGSEAEIPKPYDWRAIDNDTKEEVIGHYLVKAGDTLTVFEESDQLFMKETGQLAYELFQVGENRFVMTMQEFDVSFGNDTVRFNGMVNLKAPRIKTDY